MALLSRSIRIVSAGDAGGGCDVPSGKPPAIRTAPIWSYPPGIQELQIQGVEFAQLGQGGRLGHYPVHFHMARQMPDDTYRQRLLDQRIDDPLDRPALAPTASPLPRNVGYKSIGHGYYLEDGTEIDNKLYSNLGIFARAAVDNPQNPRKVPGILAPGPIHHGRRTFPTIPTTQHPSVFWITNGWNDFVGNMAAGAGLAPAWFVPAKNSDRPGSAPKIPTSHPGRGHHKKWDVYAALQDAGLHARGSRR